MLIDARAVEVHPRQIVLGVRIAERRRGELEDADKALDRSLVAARSSGSEFEVLLSLSARGLLAHVRGEAPASDDVAETESIAERHGIDSVPPLIPTVLSV